MTETQFPDASLDDIDVEEPDYTKVDASVKPKKKGRPMRQMTTQQWHRHCVTHHPKEPGCPVCERAKAQRQPRRKISKPEDHEGFAPVKFGDTVTADHGFVKEDQDSRAGDKCFLAIQDRYTSFIMASPAPTKSAAEVVKSFQQYFGPKQKPGIVYTDSSKEFEAAFKQLEYLADNSVPHLPRTRV